MSDLMPAASGLEDSPTSSSSSLRGSFQISLLGDINCICGRASVYFSNGTLEETK